MAEKKPKVDYEGQKELRRLDDEFDQKSKNLQELANRDINEGKVEEGEQQTQLSQKEKQKMKEVYLKPLRQIASKEKFNEKFRKEYEFQSEYVYFTAENKEVIGESIQLWTKKFPGMPAQYWEVPVNKPIWGPRFLAEQLADCKYTVFTMDQKTITGEDGMGEYYGGIKVEKRVPRLAAYPETKKSSIFTGKSTF